MTRRCGVLLHPTSLPGPHGSGDLGEHARHFVDWLVAAGQTLWQVLPLAGIGPGNSPYMSNSAFAGNVLLVDLHELHEQGWLDAADLAPTPGLQAEAVDYALQDAIEEHAWSPTARARLLFLVLDAPPHQEPQTLNRLRTSLLRAAARDQRSRRRR